MLSFAFSPSAHHPEIYEKLFFLSASFPLFYFRPRDRHTDKNNPISGWGLIVRYPRVMRSNTWWQVSYQRNYINDLRAFSLLLLMTLIFHEHTQCFLFPFFWSRAELFFVSTLYRNEISTEWEPHVASRLYCNVKYPLNTCALAADWKWWGRREESSSPVSTRQNKSNLLSTKCHRIMAFELYSQIDQLTWWAADDDWRFQRAIQLH